MRKKKAFTRYMGKNINDSDMVSYVIDRYRLDAYNKSEREIGYNLFGPFLYGYIKWLHEMFISNKYDAVLFLSRDGKIIKRAYETAYGTNSTLIYFYASRKALLGATFWLNMDYEHVLDSMFIPSIVTLEWLMNRWGIEYTVVKDYIIDNGIDIKEKVDGRKLQTNKQIKMVYERAKPLIRERSQMAFKSFIQYLDNAVGKANKIAVVDIGWYGNMQKSICSIIDAGGLSMKVDGYYLGIVPDSKNQIELNMKGYLYANNKNTKLFVYEKYINSLLELFFMADHGSLLSYDLNENNVDLSFEEWEYNDSWMAKFFKEIQDSAIAFINDFKGIGEYLPCDEMAFSKNFLHFLLKPTLETAIIFGNMQIWDAGWKYIAKPSQSCIQLKLVFNEFRNVSWKVGYLKRFLKWPLPYADLLFFVRSIMHCEGRWSN